MSFRINTNVAAMGALRSVGLTNDELNKSIQRLSTGLRINSGADDPAGLIVSENFRTQIASLGRAIQNNQDAINYAKTAEGALDEVNRLLSEARTLAVASANSAVVDHAQLQANQNQLNAIAESISRIAQNTEFGQKKLLDGSSGINAGVIGGRVSRISLSGQWNGDSLSQASAITMNLTTAATKASVTGHVYATGATALAAGQVSVNGLTFNVTASDTVDSLVSRLNAATSQTGVQATYATGGAIVLTQTKYGSANQINVTDSAGILLAAAGSATAAGVDAVADVTIDTNGATAGGLVTETMTGGRNGLDALTLTDTYGNSIQVTETGNVAGSSTVGQLFVGAAQFQVGANQGQTVSLSLGNYAADNLGLGVVSGKSLANLDLTSTSGANDAMSVIDAAVSEVSTLRGRIGNFQRNVLETNVRTLGVAQENLSASESQIRDVDIATEMTNFTRLQILQQSGLAALAQANAAPQSVLKLLGG
jgi:flagellin